MSTPKSKPRRSVVLAAYAMMVLAIPAFVAAIEIGSRIVLGMRDAPQFPLFYLPPDAPSTKVLADEPWFQLLDPQLSHAYSVDYLKRKLPDFTILPGFVAYADPEKKKNALRIFTLGGSTTDAHIKECWPYFLQKKLDALGVDAIVFNGGVAGYSTNQELLKLQRDVLPMKPNIVLGLSGVNDQGFAHSHKQHPMIHPYQAKVFGALAGHQEPSRFFPNTVDVVRRLVGPNNAEDVGITFGPEVRTSPAAQWERNIRMMHAVCEELGIHYLGFRQPVLSVGNYEPSPDEVAMIKKYSDAVNRPGGKSTYVEIINDFYKQTQSVPERLDYCVDFVDLFVGKSGMYRDARHQTAAGAEVLAEAMIGELQARGLIAPKGTGSGAQ